MTKFEDLSLIERIGIVSLLLISIFLIAGAIGYFSVSLEDNGDTAENTILATGAKIGFLYSFLPVIIGYTLSTAGRFLKNFLNLTYRNWNWRRALLVEGVRRVITGKYNWCDRRNLDSKN